MFNNFNSQWQGPYKAPSDATMRQFNPLGNVIRVTGLEEAIMRTTEYGSEMVYFHQDKNVFYLVKMDMNGRKSWQEFPFTVPDQNNEIPVTKSDLQTLVARIEVLEKQLGTSGVPKMEVKADA